MFLWWGPQLIQFYNDAYRPSFGNNGKHPTALGQRGEDCWPEIWPIIKPLINQVLEKGEPTWSIDQLIPIYRNGKIEDVYWTFGYSPVYDDNGNRGGVLVICSETTENVKNLQKLKESHHALGVSEDNLRNLVMHAPVAIGHVTGRELIIEAANQKILQIWGKDSGIIGLPLSAALPELLEQPFLQILDKVYTTGIPFFGNNYKALLEHEGVLQEMFFDFVYQPIKNNEGISTGIIIVANNVTENVQTRKKIEQSEDRLRQVVMKSPFIMLVMKGPEFVVEIANPALYNYWNKTGEETLGKPLLTVLPELEGQPFPTLLKQVLETGEAYGDNEVPNYFETELGIVTKYISFLYEPIIEEDGSVSRILVAAEDMTQAVNDRNKILATEENLRLSLEAAELGRFDMDLVNGTLFWDARCRELFGIAHENTVTYENDFLPGLHPEDKERVSKIIDDVFNKTLTNGDYDVEYRTIGAKDKKLRWVRAKGKAFFNEKDEAIRFIGSVLDITDKKSEELRRNDFFAMASHELKTPLTSIKSYVQMLLNKAIKDEDTFRIDSLNRVNKNVNKMTGLIQGFLNNAKILEGKFELQFENVDIYPLLNEIARDAQMISPGHQLKVVPCGDVYVRADGNKLVQVMENLVSNAVKYSPKGTTVLIGCVVKNKYAEIYVQDNGIGISEKDQQRLFDRFYRVQNEKVQHISGFGIGLYLVSEILRYHQSQIMVESEEGKGSRFYFRLPIVDTGK
jgi:two-component system sensor histidine kinase VicK